MRHGHIDEMVRDHSADQQAKGGFLAVTCMIAGQEYGLPVTAVREVVSVPSMLPLAGAPSYVRGLLNLRSRFIPVLDGRTLVGQPAPIELTNQVIILGKAAPEFGLLVDQARSVSQVTPALSVTAPRETGLPILGDVLEASDRAALLLNVQALRELLPTINVEQDAA